MISNETAALLGKLFGKAIKAAVASAIFCAVAKRLLR